MKANINNSQLVSSEENSIQEMISRYGKYWKWYLLSCVLFLALGVSYVLLKSPVYSVVSNVLIKTDDGKSSTSGTASVMKSMGVGDLGGLMSAESILDEIQVMSSQTLTKQMIYNLGLYTSYEQVQFPFNKSLYNNSPIIIEANRSLLDTLEVGLDFKIKIDKEKKINVLVKIPKHDKMQYTFTSLPADIKTPYGVFRLKTSEKVAYSKLPLDINAFVSGLNPAAEDYKKIIDISQVSKKSNVIQLSINDDNKPRGKDILNEIVRLYNIDALTDKNKTALSTMEFLKVRTDTIYGELKAIEGDIEQYKIKNKISDTQTEAGSTLGQIVELKKKDIEYEIQRSMISSIGNYLKNSNTKDQLIPQSLVLSGEVNSAINQYNQLIFEKMKLLRNSNEKNPLLQALNEQIEVSKNQVQNTLHHALKDISMAQQDWGQQEGILMNRRSQLPQLEREYVDIKRQQETKSEIYLFLLQKMEETQLTLAASTPKAKIIDKAYSLAKPVAPKKMIVLGGCLAFGLMISFLIVYLLDLMKTTIGSKEELEKLSKREVIGEIASNHSAKKIIVAGANNDPSSELFRLLRGNLMFLLDEPDKKVILVTSTLPTEGKTYISSNLAVSLSLTDKKVALIGLDIRNPKLNENFKLMDSPGVTNFLSDSELKVKDIATASETYPGLDIILSGPIPPNPNELLLKKRLDDLFEQLRRKYDYIIVDSAPVGVVSDTFHLNRIADVCLYVTRIGITRKESVKFANTISQSKKLKNLYIVANGISLKDKNGGYGYGYSK